MIDDPHGCFAVPLSQILFLVAGYGKGHERRVSDVGAESALRYSLPSPQAIRSCVPAVRRSRTRTEVVGKSIESCYKDYPRR